MDVEKSPRRSIQIRFNTDKERINGELPAWRVLIDGVEHLAKDVRVEVPMWTSEDILPSGQRKWHLSCEGEAFWDSPNGNCVIR